MRAFHSTILFFTLSLFALNSSFAQGWQWSRHFGGPGHDYGQIGAVDAADNVYCFGTYGGSGPGQYHDLYIQNDTLRGSRAGFLTKHDGDGNLLWALNIISLNPDFGISVLSISMNVDSTALFITGAHSATCAIGAVVLADSGAYIAKVDPNGNCLWASNIGTSGTIGRKIIHNDLGEIFVSGVVPQSGTSFVGNVEIPPGAFLAKFAMDGTQIWAKSLISGLNSSNYPRYIPLSLKYLNGSIFAYGPCDASANGDPIIADTITVPVSYGVHALISVDGLNGVAQWIKTLPYSSTNYGFENRMTVGDSERIYCVGYTDGDTAVLGQILRLSLNPAALAISPPIVPLVSFLGFQHMIVMLSFRISSQ
ncbi:MAG: hypothetical protein LKM36_07830 [Flavobacteriales bacterium]|jgi:hypothetical protein|nr:hypothetical protein [Flavobacteriales bacterium]